MKTTKRILAVLLVLAMAISMAACGSSTTTTTTAGDSSASTADTAAADTTADAAADETVDDAADAAAEIEPYMFNISYGGTPGSSMVAVMELLQEILSENSGGAFTFNAYNDNSYKESQALDELTNNIVDLVYLASGSTCTTVTEVAYLGMPGCFRYSDDADEFFDFEDTISGILSEIYDGYGIHYLGLRPPTRMAIVGTGDVPTTKEALQGKVVRVSGTWLGRLAVSMNLATSNIGLSELATALQRKTIDSCITGIEQVYSQMLGEVVDYACVMPETDGIGALVIDEDTWAKLSDAQKACVEESVAQWMEECLTISNEFYEQAISHLEENNVEIYYYSDEECDEFLSTVSDVYTEIDAQTTDLGHSLRDAVLEFREAHS
ncbi:MAG: TRAP transporter substrate-binding protein DctP [Oscillospiraceae bacterium]|nr:TRAP transporter substrate-binding protein DctP [Oscillospiraceae bacterium]